MPFYHRFKNVGFPNSVKGILELTLEAEMRYTPSDLPVKTEAERKTKNERTAMVNLFRAAYTFLLQCCQGNNEIKDMLYSSFKIFVQHLNVRATPYPGPGGNPDPGPIDLNASALILELFVRCPQPRS